MKCPATPVLRTLLLFLLLSLLALSGCDRQDARPVDLSERRSADDLRTTSDPKAELSIGIGSIITPKEGYVYYSRLLSYLEKKLGIHVQAVDAGNYAAMNQLLADRGVDAAFVCGGPYVDAHRDIGVELLVAPVVNGSMTYRSYLIAPKASKTSSYADLRNKSFAFTDPGSNSGYLVPVHELKEMQEQPASFFSSTVFTYGHDRSIRAVATGLVDGAAVDSLIYDYLAKTEPGMIAKTRIVEQSEPFGIPPLVCRPGIPEKTRNQLQEALLQAHLDPEGLVILRGMNIERFAIIDDSAYDSIRLMQQTISLSAKD